MIHWQWSKKKGRAKAFKMEEIKQEGEHCGVVRLGGI
jgi:hypothetical protein